MSCVCNDLFRPICNKPVKEFQDQKIKQECLLLSLKQNPVLPRMLEGSHID